MTQDEYIKSLENKLENALEQKKTSNFRIRKIQTGKGFIYSKYSKTRTDY